MWWGWWCLRAPSKSSYGSLHIWFLSGLVQLGVLFVSFSSYPLDLDHSISIKIYKPITIEELKFIWVDVIYIRILFMFDDEILFDGHILWFNGIIILKLLYLLLLRPTTEILSQLLDDFLHVEIKWINIILYLYINEIWCIIIIKEFLLNEVFINLNSSTNLRPFFCPCAKIKYKNIIQINNHLAKHFLISCLKHSANFLDSSLHLLRSTSMESNFIHFFLVNNINILKDKVKLQCIFILLPHNSNPYDSLSSSQCCSLCPP